MKIEFPDELVEQIAQRAAEIIAERQAPAQRWLTVAEAAEYLGCSRQAIYDMRSRGRLSRPRPGRPPRVDRRELDALMEGR